MSTIETLTEMSARTMIARREISAPTRFLVGAMSPVVSWQESTLLHHGEGRAYMDSNAFRREGATVTAYDPNSEFSERREMPCAHFHFVVSNYVLNTLPPETRDRVRDEILLSGTCAFISVRADFDGISGTKYADGVITSRGTFQRAFTPTEFRRYLNRSEFARRVDILASNRNFVMARVFTESSGIPDQRY